MRYAADQSEKTKARVVKIAAAQIRKHGPDKVGVAAVMAKAGLTHGGFYAHFESKDDLVAAAIAQMFQEARGVLQNATEGKTGLDALRSYINAYVSRTHRDAPERGCAIAALSSDIHRLGKKPREAYDRGVTTLAGRIAGFLVATPEPDRRALSLSMLAEMTGAVAAARAVLDEDLSDEILASARRSLRARAGIADIQHEGKAK